MEELKPPPVPFSRKSRPGLLLPPDGCVVAAAAAAAVVLVLVAITGGVDISGDIAGIVSGVAMLTGFVLMGGDAVEGVVIAEGLPSCDNLWLNSKIACQFSKVGSFFSSDAIRDSKSLSLATFTAAMDLFTRSKSMFLNAISLSLFCSSVCSLALDVDADVALLDSAFILSFFLNLFRSFSQETSFSTNSLIFLSNA